VSVFIKIVINTIQFNMKTKISLTLLLSFSFYLLSSQVPQGFNYQAIARDGSNNIIPNYLLPVRITLQTASTGGTVIWQETQSVTTNQFGLLGLVVGKGTRTGGTATLFSDINWGAQLVYLKTEIKYPTASYADMGTTQLWSVPYSITANDLSGPVKKLGITGTTLDLQEALFEVKNNTGQTVFAVYNEGVRVFVDDGAKGSKGGFAIGGFGSAKAPSQEYLRVTKDSTRVYVNPLVSKGSKGGFAIGGFDQAKSPATNYLNLTSQNYFIGLGAGKSTTTGVYNSFMGYLSGASNTTGSSNVFLGFNTGFSNTSGSSNVLLGNQAGYSNTSGYNNVIMGTSAGYSNLDGYSNTFIGNSAGNANTSGFFNVFIGEMAGISNTTASRNVFIGPLAGRYNTTGQANSFFGQQTGEANTTGSFNLFAGRAAGNFNTTGLLNTYLGVNAGNSNTTGSENVNLGGESGKLNGTGSYNVNLGTGAGYGNTNGSSNINIGYYTGVSLNSGSRNIFIGSGAGGGLTSTSDKLFIENSNADLNNSLIYGDFSTDYLKLNANVDIRNSLSFPNSGAVLWVGTKEALWFNGTYYSWGFGGTYNYFGSPVTIGSTANPGPTYKLYVAGNVFASGYVTAPSDSRYKKNVSELTDVLASVEKMRGVYYYWDTDKYPDMKFEDTRQLGFIAQEVEPLFPELVKTDNKGFKSMDYSKMTVVLFEAIKEQQKQIDTQNKRIEELEKAVAALLSAKK
jgi:hypothetical protein